MKKLFSFFTKTACFGALIVIIPASSGAGAYGPAAGIPAKVPEVTKARVNDVLMEPVPGIVANDHGIKAGLLYDASQNKIVWEKGLYSSFPIASLTKLMTVLLVLEDIRDAKTNWDSMVTVTPEAAAIGSSKIWMKPGQLFSVEDLTKSAMICSANDACYLLGQYRCGSEPAFVERMNARANALGMYNTYYSNPTGLPAPRHGIDNFSSPNDLLILAKEILKYPEILRISSMGDEVIMSEKQRFELKTHNKLTIEYPEVDGLKTGYTRKAGFCIVATAHKEDSRLIGIVLGGTSPIQRNSFVAEMFDRYYDNFLCVGKLQKPESKPAPKMHRKYKRPVE